MGSSLTTLHIYNSLVSICDYFLGCLLWYKGTSVLLTHCTFPASGSFLGAHTCPCTTKGTRGRRYWWIRGSSICAVWSEM